ncbi:2-pyrone-4,6-dicarboxylic acid hydrolase [Pelagibacterium halotolerans B2]|uniref:2-pyrone-4,6-dicarboxylic acid hydrolase n=1 Tax=Pelagibacterium halotolerans (strain DSM 22347 / JCM 15775 / CGMCC 1.7692 / B2) TaxID=1082931 RepID=G4RCE1_PELHB|nr:2-pyrone-4,6-dicarboxylic acid hydrolase [Pelagibacterium halotolerans B2]
MFGPGDVFPYSSSATYRPEDAPKEKLFALHKHLGLSRSVVVQASCHGTDNRAMVDALSAGNGNYRGIAMVERDVTETELQGLHDAGVRGVRFNFVAHLGEAADQDAVREIVAKIKPFGWHIVVHFDSHWLADLAPFLKDLDIVTVIDHMGRIDASAGVEQQAFQLLLELMEDERFWVKVCGSERLSRSGPPFHDAAEYGRLLVEKFPDRVLWGTDWPHPNIRNNMPDDGELVDLLKIIAPTPESLRRLVVDNPTRLYWSQTQ